MINKKKPIIRADVAKLAKVSASTVSLVLNENPNTRISKETRKRVFDAAKKIGYQPNAVARALVTGRSNNIGIIIFHTGSPFSIYSAGLLSGLWTVINNAGYRVTMDAIANENDASKMYRERAADGVIMIAPPPEIVNMELMVEGDLPMVAIGGCPKNVDIDYIDMDNVAAAYQATNFLLEYGHRDILHISGPSDLISSAGDRVEGYKQAIMEAGIKVNDKLIVRGTYLYESGRTAVANAIQQGVKFSAIFAANDDLAHGAIDEMKTRGMDVPNDISVIGIRNQTQLGTTMNMLTSIQQPLETISITAAEVLLEKINKKKNKPKTRLFKGKLIKGLSVIPY